MGPRRRHRDSRRCRRLPPLSVAPASSLSWFSCQHPLPQRSTGRRAPASRGPPKWLRLVESVSANQQAVPPSANFPPGTSPNGFVLPHRQLLASGSGFLLATRRPSPPASRRGLSPVARAPVASPPDMTQGAPAGPAAPGRELGLLAPDGLGNMARCGQAMAPGRRSCPGPVDGRRPFLTARNSPEAVPSLAPSGFYGCP
jgi:hypothetical protein